MNEWIKGNGLQLLIIFIGFVVAWTTLTTRVAAVENQHDILTVRLNKIEELTERLIVIEERTGNNREDIIEIKEDIKDLKKHFDLN